MCVCRGCRRGPRRRWTGYKPRARSDYNVDQLVGLTTEFNVCQYLTEHRRARLAASLSMTESQVKVWFQNRRAKVKKERRRVTATPLPRDYSTHSLSVTSCDVSQPGGAQHQLKTVHRQDNAGVRYVKVEK